MELEGFGASLVGRAVYIVTDSQHAWIPWEFISGTQYAVRILVSGEGVGLHLVEAESGWSAIFKPTSGRDWSVIATMMKSAGGPILLTMDSHAPAAPATFVGFLDSMLAEGRTITRLWIGTHVSVPTIPDALMFPPLFDPFRATAAYEMMRRLPARDGHGGWAAMSPTEWSTLADATSKSELGIMISDVGEKAWTLFWHKIADSSSETHGAAMKRGLAWLQTGASIMEKIAHAK
jgi:hypothetical protein